VNGRSRTVRFLVEVIPGHDKTSLTESRKPDFEFRNLDLDLGFWIWDLGISPVPTCLVTGGAGFIGSHLVERLLAGGWAVRVLDTMETGRTENLAAVAPRIRFELGNVCHGPTVRRLCDGCETVFHLAAIVSVPRSLTDPGQSDRVNAEGTVTVLRAASEAGTKRLILASSSSVYGDTGGVPAREDRPPRPLSPYGVSKLAAEHACRLFQGAGRIETVVLRFFNVYGPRQDPRSPYAAVVPRFLDACRAGRPPVIYGDGLQARDFTFVGDAVEALQRAAACPSAPGEVMNVASGHPTTVRDLAERARARFPGAPAAVHQPPRVGEIRVSYADPSRVSAVLGFTPSVSLDEGIDRILRGEIPLSGVPS
jgi:UDP-glucose 4-epimerase